MNITGSEGANDSLVINALGGDDGVTATTLPAGIIKLTIDGGAGDDQLLGSQGADVFLGGDFDDFVVGDNGNDVAFLGAGDDVFQWNPGDGNDTIEGQGGHDEMLFFGANVAEDIQAQRQQRAVMLMRDIASVAMDLDDVESIDFQGSRRCGHGHRRRPRRHRRHRGRRVDLRGPNGVATVRPTH